MQVQAKSGETVQAGASQKKKEIESERKMEVIEYKRNRKRGSRQEIDRLTTRKLHFGMRLTMSRREDRLICVFIWTARMDIRSNVNRVSKTCSAKSWRGAEDIYNGKGKTGSGSGRRTEGKAQRRWGKRHNFTTLLCYFRVYLP